MQDTDVIDQLRALGRLVRWNQTGTSATPESWGAVALVDGETIAVSGLDGVVLAWRKGECWPVGRGATPAAALADLRARLGDVIARNNVSTPARGAA